MHFQLQLKYTGGDTTLMLYQSQASENFVIPFNKIVSGLVFDPKIWLLAKSIVQISGIEENREVVVKSFNLAQNYHYSFNFETTIEYSIPERNFISLKIYDLLGRETATLVSEVKASDKYSVKFNSGDLANGVYIYKLSAGSFETSRKLVVLK